MDTKTRRPTCKNRIRVLHEVAGKVDGELLGYEGGIGDKNEYSSRNFCYCRSMVLFHFFPRQPPSYPVPPKQATAKGSREQGVCAFAKAKVELTGEEQGRREKGKERSLNV